MVTLKKNDIISADFNGDGRKGPLQTIQAGSGYWSQNSCTQVLGYNSKEKPVALNIRWFNGSRKEVKLKRNKESYKIRF